MAVEEDGGWGKVSAVLFDMDGVLCNSEHLSRLAAVDVFAEMGVSDDFIPFMGTGEAKFLGGVASIKGVEGFDIEAAKSRFFEIYLDKVARKMRDEKGFFYALGKNGLRWMKIHLANLFGHGVDKLSYDRRVAFAENHMDDVFDSADRPLEGKSWWLGSKDPFQCLAVCINLAEAWRSSSPETTISYLPVHQDGSCNGLQHYAALGRDKLGAESVNLVAGEKPADVYSGIAERVCDIMRRDAQKDSATDPNVARAKLLLDQVDRKLVKQTVMTSVYGVTFIGARDQIKRRLAEQGAISDEKERYLAACYVAKVTLTALGQMFEAARAIMTWLRECAKHVLDYDLRKGEPHNCLEDACAAMKLLTKLEHGFDDTITAPNLEVRLKLVSVWLPLFIVCRDKNASPLLSNLFLRIIPQNHSEETFLIMTLPLPMSHSETLLH